MEEDDYQYSAALGSDEDSDGEGYFIETESERPGPPATSSSMSTTTHSSSSKLSQSQKPLTQESAELSGFRDQWRKQIEDEKKTKGPLEQPSSSLNVNLTSNTKKPGASSVPSKTLHTPPPEPEDDPETEALRLHLQGAQLEEMGEHQAAITYYRLAAKLDPHVERKALDMPLPGYESEESEESEFPNNPDEISSLSGLEFVHYIAGFHPSIEPASPQEGLHISDLPDEILLRVFQYLILADLDLQTLLVPSLVCRKFFLCTREDTLWRYAATKIHPSISPSPSMKPSPWESWRSYVINRPRVLYHGLYISKASYVRQGEKGLDNFYKPFHIVDYYRYIRFFTDGSAYTYTSPDHPKKVVPSLREKNSIPGMCVGRFEIHGDEIKVIVKKPSSPSPPPQRRTRRGDQIPILPQYGILFAMNFKVSSTRRRTNQKLIWQGYALHRVPPEGQTIVVPYELNSQYTPLYFSRVQGFDIDVPD